MNLQRGMRLMEYGWLHIAPNKNSLAVRLLFELHLNCFHPQFICNAVLKRGVLS